MDIGWVGVAGVDIVRSGIDVVGAGVDIDWAYEVPAVAISASGSKVRSMETLL